MKKENLFQILGEVDEQKVIAAGLAMNAGKKSRFVWMKRGGCGSMLVFGVARRCFDTSMETGAG